MRRTGFRALAGGGLVASALMAATGAQAACAQADLAGNWQLYAMTDATDGGGWIRCAINIGATATNNVKLAVGGICRSEAGQNFTITQAGSAIVVSPACAISGTVKTNVANLTFTQGTMSLDQTRFSGVGTFSIKSGQFMAVVEKY